MADVWAPPSETPRPTRSPPDGRPRVVFTLQEEDFRREYGEWLRTQNRWAGHAFQAAAALVLMIGAAGIALAISLGGGAWIVVLSVGLLLPGAIAFRWTDMQTAGAWRLQQDVEGVSPRVDLAVEDGWLHARSDHGRFQIQVTRIAEVLRRPRATWLILPAGVVVFLMEERIEEGDVDALREALQRRELAKVPAEPPPVARVTLAPPRLGTQLSRSLSMLYRQRAVAGWGLGLPALMLVGSIWAENAALGAAAVVTASFLPGGVALQAWLASRGADRSRTGVAVTPEGLVIEGPWGSQRLAWSVPVAVARRGADVWLKRSGNTWFLCREDVLEGDLEELARAVEAVEAARQP